MAFIRPVSPEHAARLRELVPGLTEFTAYDSERGGGEFPYAILVGGDDWLEGGDLGTTADLDENVRSQVLAVVEDIAAEYGETVKFIGQLPPPVQPEPTKSESAGLTGEAVGPHRPTVRWEVDVFEEDVDDLTDARQVAEAAYEKYQTDQMRPIVTVTMRDGTEVEVDLEYEDTEDTE